MNLNYKCKIEKKVRDILLISIISLTVLLLLSFFSLFIGSSSMNFNDALLAIFNIGNKANINIIYKIRMPRILTSLLIGASLSLSGLILQSILNNPMASPSTLGTTNASVLGANLAIIILSGGNIISVTFNYLNSYLISFCSFIFSFLGLLFILLLSKIKHFKSETMILIGVSLSSLFQAVTTLLQYFANDISLSSAIYWSFGDLSRTSYKEILIIFIPLVISTIIFQLFYKRLNALSFGDEFAFTSGVNIERTKFFFLLLCSIITSLSICFVGIIGFIGLIAPHIVKKIIGNNHKYTIPLSLIFGALILLISDDLARVILNGFSLPVGAITSILGAPFFLYLILSENRRKKNA